MADKPEIPFSKPTSGEVPKAAYYREDLPAGYDPGSPGQPPFIRGVHPTMYRGRLWTMRQYAGFGSAREANERYRYLLSQGQTGLSVAFDLPTQMGRDADHPLANGEVGRVGVSISTVHDMRTLLSGVPIEKVSISMTINATAPILLAMVLLVAEEQGVSWDKLRGTVQNDILKEYIARGTYIFPPKHGVRLVTDLCQYCTAMVPNWNTISISGYHIREAGSTAVQELAFTFADAIAYVEAIRDRGLELEAFAPRLSFFFNCHNNFLEEIAKFRAARALWNEIMEVRFGVADPRSRMLRFHTQTAGSSLTAQQPLNNVVRTTVQALAAVLGGTQSLHTNSFDEALGLPTAESATLALRTQQIIAAESGVTCSADPLAGSYLIERWTSELIEKTKELLQKIDGMGGMLPAIEAGFPQAEIERAAYEYQRSIEEQEQWIVGVNCFEEPSPPVPVMALDKAIEREQCSRLAAHRASRNAAPAGAALEALTSGAKKPSENLVPHMLEALRAGATLGEVSDVLRAEFGEYTGV